MAKFKRSQVFSATRLEAEPVRQPMRLANEAECQALAALSRCSLPAGSSINRFVREKVQLLSTSFLVTQAQSAFLWSNFWHYRRACVRADPGTHRTADDITGESMEMPSSEMAALIRIAAEHTGGELVPLTALIEDCAMQDYNHASNQVQEQGQAILHRASR